MRWIRRAALVVALAACAPYPPAPPPGNPQAQCDHARWVVSAAGDSLPDPWEFRCPGDADGDEALAVYNSQTHERFVVIGYPALDDDDGGVWLRYVVAHEFCHARAFEGLESNPWLDENATDACAARYGFPRP